VNGYGLYLQQVTNKAKKKTATTKMTDKNGLRMKNEMTIKEKRFSFFADPQERKADSRPTFGTLPFARHTSKPFAKVKEPNLAIPSV
jgi:hypothetical protein